MAALDGSERKVVTDKNLPHPFGFSLLGDNLYWTDWQDRSIQRANKTDGGDRLVMVSHLDDLVSEIISEHQNYNNAEPLSRWD